MKNEQLDNLFAQAKNQEVETSIKEIQSWIGYATIFTLIAAFFSKLKFASMTHVLIAATSAVTLGIGGYFLFRGTDSNQNQLANTLIYEDSIKTKTTPIPIDVVEVEKTDEDRLPSNISLPVPLPPTPIQALESNLIPEVPSPLQQFIPIAQVEQQTKVNDDESNKTGNLKPFKKLSINGMLKVILTQGEEYSYRVEGSYRENDLKITTNDKNNELSIYYNSQINKEKKKGSKTIINTTKQTDLTIYITFVSMEELVIGGVSTVKNNNVLNFDNFNLTVTGASNATLNFNCKNLKTTNSGTSDCYLYGQYQNLISNISGATNVHFKDSQQLSDAKFHISGTADASIKCNANYLETFISGAASLKIEGDTKSSKVSLSGTSNFIGKKLKTNELDASLSGASILHIECSESATISASGTSDVYLKGNPPKYKESISGVATIKKLD